MTSPGIGMAGKLSAYIEQAFPWAQAADPRVLLFYNDSEAETIDAKSDAIYAMVRDFKRRGVPMDGVGLQMHIFDLHADFASLEANIARFAALGVEVHITEMDVALPLDATGQASPADLAQQAEIYRRVAAVCGATWRQRDADLGLHRQVFLDRVEDQRQQRTGASFRSAIRAQTGV